MARPSELSGLTLPAFQDPEHLRFRSLISAQGWPGTGVRLHAGALQARPPRGRGLAVASVLHGAPPRPLRAR